MFVILAILNSKTSKQPAACRADTLEIDAEYIANIAGDVRMTIRLAGFEDIPQVSNLLSEFFAHNAKQQPNNYIATAENEKYLSSVLDSDTGVFIIAETGKTIIGLIHIEEDSTPPYPSIAPDRKSVV